MKKYTLVSFVFILSFVLLGFYANSARASNCAPGDLFNSATGQSCGSSLSVSCAAGDLFSATTGQRCTSWQTNSSVSVNQQFQIGARGEAVRAFQQMLLNAGFSPGKIDGIYGRLTDGAALSYYKKHPLPPVVSSVVISGVSGPQSLNVNQEGTWTVTAYDRSGSNLFYSVSWGDENIRTSDLASGIRYSSSTQQSATFTHSYSQAGMYTPIFYVKNKDDESGPNAQTSLSVNVGNVVATDHPFITVVSPNGGENWAKGTTHTIHWLDATPIPMYACQQGTNCYYPPQLYDINLQPTCAGDFCTAIYRPTYSIAQNISDFSYVWTVGKVWNSNNAAPDGSYLIEVCQSGSAMCDFSDHSFTITNGLVTDSSITVLSPNGGENWIQGTTQRIRWQDATLGYYNLALEPYYPPCTSNVCPMYPYHAPYKIVDGVYGSSYNWSVGKSEMYNAPPVPDGSYTMQVCRINSSICDSSNSYFSIVTSSDSTGTMNCEYANPPAGYHYEGGQPYPTCGAYLVKDNTSVQRGY